MGACATCIRGIDGEAMEGKLQFSPLDCKKGKTSKKNYDKKIILKYSPNSGGGGQQQSIDAAASADGLSRPVLTAARRTRVRVLYSQDHNNHQKANSNNTGGFPVPGLIHGRRGQVAPMLGQSPPNMLVANKRGRHCAKASTSPPRPSLNFDKMRKVRRRTEC
jgi:hypothetical protein